jgi:hypothetical protein
MQGEMPMALATTTADGELLHVLRLEMSAMLEISVVTVEVHVPLVTQVPVVAEASVGSMLLLWK